MTCLFQPSALAPSFLFLEHRWKPVTCYGGQANFSTLCSAYPEVILSPSQPCLLPCPGPPWMTSRSPQMFCVCLSLRTLLRVLVPWGCCPCPLPLTPLAIPPNSTGAVPSRPEALWSKHPSLTPLPPASSSQEWLCRACCCVCMFCACCQLLCPHLCSRQSSKGSGTCFFAFFLLLFLNLSLPGGYHSIWPSCIPSKMTE